MIAGRVEAFLTVPTGVEVSVNTGGGATAVSLTAGTYTPTSFCAHVQARLIAVMTGSWTVTLSTTTGFVTITYTGTFSVTWTSTDARDALGFTGNLSAASSYVGTKMHRGLWLPDCTLDMEGDPISAPVDSDARATEGPTGAVFTYCGNTRYVHRSLIWSHVPRARYLESVSATKGSWEQWVKDTQLGLGHAWFTPGSAFQIYNHDAICIGGDLNSGAGPTNGWKASPPITKTYATKSAHPWVGCWRIEMPSIVSSG